MQKNQSAIILLTVLAFLLVFFSGCKDLNTPPDIDSIQERFGTSYDSIETVVDFLISCGYEDVSIRDTKGTMVADLTRVQINNDDVSTAVKSLIDNGKYLLIVKNGNTIYFLMWRGLRDIGCGIAYTINGVDTPEIEYSTELTPLSEDGWFYYVSDYNTWRSNNCTEHGEGDK